MPFSGEGTMMLQGHCEFSLKSPLFFLLLYLNYQYLLVLLFLFIVLSVSQPAFSLLFILVPECKKVIWKAVAVSFRSLQFGKSHCYVRLYMMQCKYLPPQATNVIILLKKENTQRVQNFWKFCHKGKQTFTNYFIKYFNIPISNVISLVGWDFHQQR